MIRALALARLRVAKRGWTSLPGSGGWARHPGFVLVLAAGLALLVHAGLAQAFSALTVAGGAPGAREGLLALALSGALVALLAFDVDDVVRSLLLDPDVALLRRAPLRPTALLAIKAFDTAPRTLLPLVVLALPAISAYLAGTEAPLGGAVVALAALSALWLTTLAAGVALSLTLLRLVPVAHAREALGLVSTLVLTLIWIAGALVLPRALQAETEAASALTATLEAARHTAGPAATAARAIAGASSGAFATLPRDLGLLAAGALVAGAAVLLAGRFALEAVLDRISGTPAPGLRSPSRGAPPAFAWRAGSVLGAIVRRDARMLRRSWTLMTDLFVACVLWSLLPLAGLAGGTFESEGMVRLVLLSISVGLGYEVAARAIPFERHAEFWIGVAPVTPMRYLVGKLAGATAVAAPLVLSVAVVLGLTGAAGIGDLVALGGLVAGALMLSQATGLWAGARFGDPEWVNPRAMLRFAGRLVASLLVLAQLGGWLAILALFDRLSPRADPLVGGLVALVVGVGLTALPMRAAARRFRHLDSRH
ncbi:MAG: hypothetical protein ABIS67_06025 [Candidatus Eisenbacteria bacterium]